MAQRQSHPVFWGTQFSVQTLLLVVVSVLLAVPAFGNIHQLSHEVFEDVQVVHSEEKHGGRLAMQDTLLSDHDLSIHMGKDPRTLAEEHHTFTPEEVTAHTMTDKYRANNYKGTKSILISGFGRHWILDLLMNQIAIGEQAMNFVYDEVTKKYTHDKVPASTCHYHGFIRGSEHNTWVAASTCNGLMATFFDGNVSYNTAPLGQNMSSAHVIYRTMDVHRQDAESTCGVDSHRHDSQLLNKPLEELAVDVIGEEHYHRAKRQTILTPTPTRTLIEYFAVIDVAFLSFFGGNQIAASAFVNSAINFMDMAYTTINARVRSVGQLQFVGSNEFPISNSGITLLQSFNSFIAARRASLGVNFDSAQLLTGVNFDGNTIGLAFLNTVCTSSGHSLVEQLNGRPFTFTSLIMSHELGHTLSMGHDGDPGLETCNNCPASLGRCIMFPSLGSANQNLFSQCSVDAFNTVRQRSCLSAVIEQDICGNGIVEANEQCDCGLPEACTNGCCNPSTCQLVCGAQCAAGDCCDPATCMFRLFGTVCNPAQSNNTCDLEDRCPGWSANCPSTTRRNGEFCSGSTEDLCWNGNCVSRAGQCQALFGPNETPAIDSCYALNTIGDRMGNCGIDLGTSSENATLQFTNCTEIDALCGKVHCGTTGLPLSLIPVPTTIQLTTISASNGMNFTCKGATIEDLSFLLSGAPDTTVVSDGQNCGNGNVCVNQSCLPQTAADIQFCGTVDSRECNGTGVCASNLQCHCDPGFTGPLCQNVDSCPAINPCQNGGRCIGGDINFYCQCSPAYTGQFCQVALPPVTACNCMSPPVLGTTCLNGGFCMSENRLNFTCLCPPAAAGAQCEVTSSPACTVGGLGCLGPNSLCVLVQGIGTCSCDFGFVRVSFGVASEACIPQTNECVAGSNPCNNGGTCTDLPDSFRCTCPAGFTGNVCQAVDDCPAIDPCQNGGRCIDGDNAFTCQCSSAYTGQFCEDVLTACNITDPPVLGTTCLNGGFCMSNNTSNFTCLCPSTAVGAQCEFSSSPPCTVGSTSCLGAFSQCVSVQGAGTCSCNLGFVRVNFGGEFCMRHINECESNVCDNGATCTDLPDSFRCTCRAGFTGNRCQTDISECASAPCRNDGTCIDIVNGFQCVCVQGFSGTQCESTTECPPVNPCLNGGTCVEGAGTIFCQCRAEFLGPLCQRVNANLTFAFLGNALSNIASCRIEVDLSRDMGMVLNFPAIEKVCAIDTVGIFNGFVEVNSFSSFSYRSFNILVPITPAQLQNLLPRTAYILDGVGNPSPGRGPRVRFRLYTCLTDELIATAITSVQIQSESSENLIRISRFTGTLVQNNLRNILPAPPTP